MNYDQAMAEAKKQAAEYGKAVYITRYQGFYSVKVCTAEHILYTVHTNGEVEVTV